MGGTRITFRNLELNCNSQPERPDLHQLRQRRLADRHRVRELLPRLGWRLVALHQPLAAVRRAEHDDLPRTVLADPDRERRTEPGELGQHRAARQRPSLLRLPLLRVMRLADRSRRPATRTRLEDHTRGVFGRSLERTDLPPFEVKGARAARPRQAGSEPLAAVNEPNQGVRLPWEPHPPIAVRHAACELRSPRPRSQQSPRPRSSHPRRPPRSSSTATRPPREPPRSGSSGLRAFSPATSSSPPSRPAPAPPPRSPPRPAGGRSGATRVSDRATPC